MTAARADRLFLDANVLFSAAYRSGAGLARLWRRRRTELITSRYALEEATANLSTSEQRGRLARLMESVEVVAEASDARLSPDLDLTPKDRPILAAAIRAGATHLVTGDVTHFGPHLDRTVAGVRIVTPARLLGHRR